MSSKRVTDRQVRRYMDSRKDGHTQAAAARKTIAEERYPRTPRLAPLRSALAKLDPASVPRPLPERVPLP